ncbi:sugar phosphate isomerase/epimerase family protein [Agromyces sp. NPDC056523]|uniref:sugar phosphate isomerase/epimerase family protein n=1 Tax=Agromyces sp. NPDC056523 TaxID=3345850 RepID=UPI00366CA3E7
MSAHPRLSLNQATIKHATLDEALQVTAEAGYQAIGLWREPVAELGLEQAARRLGSSGLRFTSLCRAGFFTMPEGPERRASIDDNRRAIEETATLAAAGAPGSTAVLVLVAGGIPAGSSDLIGARARVADALAELAPDAEAGGVQLAIEPLHPMYVSDRAVVSTLKQALDLAAPFAPEVVGVEVDTFHVWWDPEALDQIARAGREGRIASYQVCDWKAPLPADVLLARHYPGDGVVDFASFTEAVEATGYDRDIEVELFNAEIWATPFAEVADRTAASFDAVVAPHLAKAPATSSALSRGA